MNAPLEQPAQKARPKVKVNLIVIGLCAMFGLPLLLRAFLLEAFQMPSGSMIPTLLIGDHFFVNKTVKTPARGDIIAFKYPLGEDSYLKRVIGVPGDTVAVEKQVVIVNGKPVPRRPLSGEGCSPCVFEEHLGAHTYRVQYMNDRSQDFDRVEVPAGHYFVIGDNRDNSNDSRVWGTVPARNIHGRAAFIWYSVDPTGGGMRWDRIGHGIE